MTIIQRLRKHALPDPDDEREVLHAPLLREAADLIESLSAQVAELKKVLRIACPEDIEQSCDECAPGPCVGCWVKDARLLIAAKEEK